MGNILIVDDQKDICDAITAIAARLGHTVSCAHTQRDGLDAAQAGSFDLVLLDVRLPDSNGLDILPRLRKLEPFPEVIILTGYGDANGAELAIRNGAWDYIEKPSSTKRIRLFLERAMQYQDEKSRRRRTTALDREGIVGNSPALRDCLELDPRRKAPRTLSDRPVSGRHPREIRHLRQTFGRKRPSANPFRRRSSY